MFWRKRKFQLNETSPLPVSDLAARLGLERRYAARILYPSCSVYPVLPMFTYQRAQLQAYDISAGGCCLLDPAGLFGPSVGNDVHLEMHFRDGAVSVHGRIVSRVDQKRHIQFLNLPEARQDELKNTVSFGDRARSVRATLDQVEHGPALIAREVWASHLGDSVVIEDHIHRLAQLSIAGIPYILYRRAWPVKDVSTPIRHEELFALIIFLRNISQPSDLLTALIDYVETIGPEGEAK